MSHRHDGPLTMLRRGVEPAQGDNPSTVVQPKHGVTPKGEPLRDYTASPRAVRRPRDAELHP
jgi:hypothetical protein